MSNSIGDLTSAVHAAIAEEMNVCANGSAGPAVGAICSKSGQCALIGG